MLDSTMGKFPARIEWEEFVEKLTKAELKCFQTESESLLLVKSDLKRNMEKKEVSLETQIGPFDSESGAPVCVKIG
jgi:hypothetical protein